MRLQQFKLSMIAAFIMGLWAFVHQITVSINHALMISMLSNPVCCIKILAKKLHRLQKDHLSVTLVKINIPDVCESCQLCFILLFPSQS